jgi:hypothetical protein
MTRGVNIPQLSTEQRRRIKEGLGDVFELEINPLLAQWLPEAGDWEGWHAFEGAYDESMHRLRMHITKAIGRDPRRLYGPKRINPTLQVAGEQTTETAISLQAIRRNLSKLKDTLHAVVESEDRRTRIRCKPRKNTRRGHRTDETEIHEEARASSELVKCRKDRRILRTNGSRSDLGRIKHIRGTSGRVIDWLDSMITTQVMEELQGMNARAMSLKVQEAYRTLKGIAMKC